MVATKLSAAAIVGRDLPVHTMTQAFMAPSLAVYYLIAIGVAFSVRIALYFIEPL